MPIKIRRGKLTARRDDSLLLCAGIWLALCAGIWLALGVALFAVAQAITIVGLPNAYVLAKSLGTAFNPVGKKCVSKAVSDELKRRAASKKVNEMTR